MRRGVSGLAMAAALLMGAPASAQTSSLGQVGAWNAYGGRSTSGVPLCGMSVRGADRIVHVKYFRGNPRLVIQVIKDNWQIPERQSVPVRMVVGATDSWRATAQGAGRLIEFTIPREQIPAFERAFRGGSGMRIEFLAGNEPAWQASLRGSSAAADLFVRCIRGVNAGGGGQATQPFGDPGADGRTQPFGEGGGMTPPAGRGVPEEAPPERSPPPAPTGGPRKNAS